MKKMVMEDCFSSWAAPLAGSGASSLGKVEGVKVVFDSIVEALVTGEVPLETVSFDSSNVSLKDTGGRGV